MKTLCNKLTTGMLWWLVISSSILIFSFAGFVGINACIANKANNVRIKIANVEISINRNEEILSQSEKSVDNAYKNIETFLSISSKAKKSEGHMHHQAKSSAVRLLDYDQQRQLKSESSLSKTLEELKYQAEQIGNQRKSLQELKNEIMQLK